MTATGPAASATLLVMRIASREGGGPVEVADRATSVADARSLICLMLGVCQDDISAEGYDLTWECYQQVRESWVRWITAQGWSADDGAGLSRAMAYWASHRPSFTAGDSWLVRGHVAHMARWPDGCGRDACDLCEEVPW